MTKKSDLFKLLAMATPKKNVHPSPLDAQGFFTQKSDIEDWLTQHGVANYTILKNLKVNVAGDVFLNDKKLKTIPVRFHRVEGLFNCANNQLTHLLFAPRFFKTPGNLNGVNGPATGGFYAQNNQLQSLQGLPPIIHGDLVVETNQLTSLKGCPRVVKGTFDCARNQLNSLGYGPTEVGKNYRCERNQLTTLEGSPQKVEDFACQHNLLTSLKFAPLTADSLWAANNRLTSLEHCPPQLKKMVDIGNNQLQSFKGLPAQLDYLDAGNNPLTDFSFFPAIEGNFYFQGHKYKSLLQKEAKRQIALQATQVDRGSLHLKTQRLTNPQEIEAWLKQYGVKNYVIQPTYAAQKTVKTHTNKTKSITTIHWLVDVRGSVNLRGKALWHIPFQFGHIQGDFDCSRNLLLDLSFAPHTVEGEFDCQFNFLFSLQRKEKKNQGPQGNQKNNSNPVHNTQSHIYSHIYKGMHGAVHSHIQRVGKSFNCANNFLKDLIGAPLEIGESLHCHNNCLHSLQGAPKTVPLDFTCYNNKLKTLRFAPQAVGGNCELEINRITSLEFGPVVGGDYNVSGNCLTSLQYVQKDIKGFFACIYNQLKTLEHCPKTIGHDFLASNNRLETLAYLPEHVEGIIRLSNNPKLQELQNETDFQTLRLPIRIAKEHQELEDKFAWIGISCSVEKNEENDKETMGTKIAKTHKI